MIKKVLKGLLGLFIVGFGIINFSSAGYVGHIGQSFNSPFDDGLNIGIYKYGNFISKKVSLEKKVFYINSNSGYNSFWFWGNNDGNIGLYNYFQTSYKISQGFISTYSFCDYFSGDNLSEISSPGNCVVSVISTGSYDIIDNFLSILNDNDYYYFNINYGSNHIYSNSLCFSSSLFDKSLCFTNCYTDSPSSRSCYSFGGTYYYGNVSNSLQLSSSFDNLPSFILFNSPGNSDSGISAGYENIVCPTVGQLLSYYDSSLYYTGVCYSPSVIYTGGQFQQVVPSSIFELFTDLNDFKTHLQLYGNYCNSVSTLCQQAFSGKDLQYLYIANLNNNLRSTEKDVYQYCNLALNHSPNESSCVSSGVFQDGIQVSREDVINSLGDGGYSVVLPVTGLVNGDTTVFNAFSINSSYTGDVIDNIQILFTKFTSLFSQQTGNSTGILPKFFLIFFIAFVLFRFFKLT